MSSWDGSERTLLQERDRQKHLEYEFKQLKAKASKIGEEGLNYLKEGFPYYFKCEKEENVGAERAAACFTID